MSGCPSPALPPTHTGKVPGKDVLHPTTTAKKGFALSFLGRALSGSGLCQGHRYPQKSLSGLGAEGWRASAATQQALCDSLKASTVSLWPVLHGQAQPLCLSRQSSKPS